MTPPTGLLDQCVVYGVLATDSATPKFEGDLCRIPGFCNVAPHESGRDTLQSAERITQHCNRWLMAIGLGAEIGHKCHPVPVAVF